MLDIFPDLASRLNRDLDAKKEIHNTPGPSAVQKGPETKFSGPFSIESILKKDTCSRQCPKSSVLYMLPSTLDGRNQDLKGTLTGIGTKRKSGLEYDICGSAKSRSELRGNEYEKANAALSSRYRSTYSTHDIRSLPECPQTFLPTKRMRLCPDLPDTLLPRKVAASQFHHSLNFNVPNHLLYPLSVYHFCHWHFGLWKSVAKNKHFRPTTIVLWNYLVSACCICNELFLINLFPWSCCYGRCYRFWFATAKTSKCQIGGFIMHVQKDLSHLSHSFIPCPILLLTGKTFSSYTCYCQNIRTNIHVICF